MKIKRPKPIHIGSHSELFDEIAGEQLENIVSEKFSEKSYVAAYFDNCVRIGTWENKDWHFADDFRINHKYIQKIRVFNRQSEFLAWRSRGILKGRFRQDDEKQSGTDALEVYQLLYGTKMRPYQNGFSIISEERGFRMALPFENLDAGKRICIRTRNYIGQNGAGQATYCDCRFLAFSDGENDLL